MTTTKDTFCSESVSHRVSSNWSESRPCARKATVLREGKSYCTTHDPERRARRLAATCHEVIENRYRCGRPAIAEKYGYGVCELHTEEAVRASVWLMAAAPALLEALRDLMDWQNGPPLPSYTEGWTKAMKAGRDAITQAEGKE